MSVSRTVSETFSVKEWRDLETGVGSFNDIELTPFDRPYTTFYWSAIVNIALSCTVFLVIWYFETLKSGLEVIQYHSNWYHSKACVVSYSPSIVTIALFYIIREIKRDIGRKSWFFHTPLAFDSAVRGSSLECHPVWYGETRMVGLPVVKKIWGYV